MILLGIGAGIVASPLLIAAMSAADSSVSGFVSGLIYTVSMTGNALGLALVAITTRANYLMKQGAAENVALNAGYHAAFAVGLVACVVASLIAMKYIPDTNSTADPKPRGTFSGGSNLTVGDEGPSAPRMSKKCGRTCGL
jgi:MFS family permease